MDDNTTEHAATGGEPTRQSRWSGWGRPAAMGAAGLLAGGLLAGTITASAQDSSGTQGSDGTSSTASTTPGGDDSKPQRSDEELLTGDTAERVEEAALEEYPGATVVRIETDSDGVYEAHLVTAEGEPVIVELDEDFTVTGTETHGGRGGRGHHGPGDRLGDGSTSTPDPSSTGTSA